MKREAFNKYNVVELMSQLMAVLKREGLDDAMKALKKIAPSINDAWMKREGAMKISDRIRQAAPPREGADTAFVQKEIAKMVETRLGLVEKYVKDARAALSKWKQNPRKYAQQLSNVTAALKAISAAGKSTILAVDKLQK